MGPWYKRDNQLVGVRYTVLMHFAEATTLRCVWGGSLPPRRALKPYNDHLLGDYPLHNRLECSNVLHF